MHRDLQPGPQKADPKMKIPGKALSLGDDALEEEGSRGQKGADKGLSWATAVGSWSLLPQRPQTRGIQLQERVLGILDTHCHHSGPPHWWRAALQGCHLLPHLQAAPVARGSPWVDTQRLTAGNRGGAGAEVTSPEPISCLDEDKWHLRDPCVGSPGSPALTCPLSPPPGKATRPS